LLEEDALIGEKAGDAFLGDLLDFNFDPIGGEEGRRGGKCTK